MTQRELAPVDQLTTAPQDSLDANAAPDTAAEPADESVSPSKSGNETPSGWKRLHTATIWLPGLEAALGTLVPGFFVGFYVGHLNFAFFALCFVFVPVAAFSSFRFLTLRYRLANAELLVETGVVVRRERRIPLGRIQDSEIRQGILHRLLGLAKVEITTAGSDALEASLNVLSLSDAQWLKESITALPDHLVGSDRASQEDSKCLCELSIRDLVLGGLTSNLVASVGALIGAILYFRLFFVFGSAWLDDASGKAIERSGVNRMVDGFEQQLPQDGAMGAVSDFVFADTLAKSIFLVTFGLLFSIGSYAIRYHGFRLVRRQGILEKAHGLLTYRKSSLASERVQALKIEEGLLRRWFKLASIRVDSAGDRSEIGDQKKRDVLVPVVRRESAFSLASQTIPGLVDREPAWKKVSRRAIMRGTKKGWLLLLLAMVHTYVLSEWMTLIWLPAIPLVYFLNYQWYRNTGYFMDDDFLIRRKGWLNRETLFLPTRNVQNVSLIQSFFDRRAKLATLAVDTAGQSNTGGGPVIRHLPLDEAKQMHRHLAMRAAAIEPII